MPFIGDASWTGPTLLFLLVAGVALLVFGSRVLRWRRDGWLRAARSLGYRVEQQVIPIVGESHSVAVGDHKRLTVTVGPVPLSKSRDIAVTVKLPRSIYFGFVASWGEWPEDPRHREQRGLRVVGLPRGWWVSAAEETLATELVTKLVQPLTRLSEMHGRIAVSDEQVCLERRRISGAEALRRLVTEAGALASEPGWTLGGDKLSLKGQHNGTPIEIQAGREGNNLFTRLDFALPTPVMADFNLGKGVTKHRLPRKGYDEARNFW